VAQGVDDRPVRRARKANGRVQGSYEILRAEQTAAARTELMAGKIDAEDVKPVAG